MLLPVTLDDQKLKTVSTDLSNLSQWQLSTVVDGPGRRQFVMSNKLNSIRWKCCIYLNNAARVTNNHNHMHFNHDTADDDDGKYVDSSDKCVGLLQHP